MKRLFSFIVAAALCFFPAASSFAWWQSVQQVGVSAGGGGFSLTFQSSVLTSLTTATIDYGTMTYGSGNTRVIAMITWRAGASPTVTGVTIGGTALTQVSGAYVGGGVGPDFADIWVSSAPLAGSSGDVQVTWSAVPAGPSNAVALYNLVTNSPTVSSVNKAEGVSNTTLGATVTIPTGGGAVVGAYIENNGFTTATNFTVDSNLGTGREIFGHTTATGSVTPTINASPSDHIVMNVAAWGP